MREIPLTKGYVALVDDGDFDRLIQRRWRVLDTGPIPYAMGTVPGNGKRNVLMHREIMGLADSPTPHIDHIDGDGLNNCRSNLRTCTRSMNGGNRHGAYGEVPFKGVSVMPAKYRHRRPYTAKIQANGEKYHLGYFATPVEAALAYDHAAKQMFGEFACLNFPNDAPAIHVEEHGRERMRDVAQIMREQGNVVRG